jgi:Type II secretion system (T2SS), protein M subtype b
VRVRFSIEGTLETVERTLYAVQTSKPAMFVDSMTIAAPNSVSRDRAPRLGLDIEVVGYIRSVRE